VKLIGLCTTLPDKASSLLAHPLARREAIFLSPIFLFLCQQFTQQKNGGQKNRRPAIVGAA
jgi:hypothetical protein